MAGYTDGQGLRAAFNGTTGVAISPDGATAYVADRGNHAIRSIQLATGLVQTLAGAQGTPEAGFQDGPGPSARLNAPWGVAISPDSAWLYVADTLNHAVRRVALPGGDVVTIAGTNASGLADGLSLINGSDASAAPDDQRLDSPRGVAVSPAGDFLVVADTGNHAVRRLEILPGPDAGPAGAPTYYAYNLTTIAGNATAGYQDTADGEPLFSGPTRAVVAPCAPAPAGIGADSWGTLGLYTPYLYNQVPVPSAEGPPAATVCDVNGALSWKDVIAMEKAQTASVGGLGSLATNSSKVWVCLQRLYEDPACPSPPDRACFVWLEPLRHFAYWGRDSYLHLSVK